MSEISGERYVQDFLNGTIWGPMSLSEALAFTRPEGRGILEAGIEATFTADTVVIPVGEHETEKAAPKREALDELRLRINLTLRLHDES